jgi:hypothetical protein
LPIKRRSVLIEFVSLLRNIGHNSKFKHRLRLNIDFV